MTDLKPSKSALKREDKERQALGVRLIDLDQSILADLNLDSSLFEAIIAAKGMRSHGALRRQKQLIGKYMRSADVDGIRAALESTSLDAAREKRDFRKAEVWRDKLLNDASRSLTELQAVVGDTTTIENLLKRLSKAAGDREQKRLKRELFRALRATLDTAE